MSVQVFGTQHLLATQLPVEQFPQLSVPLQPSDAEPQLKPRPEQVFGVQAHWNAAVQVSPVWQLPQLASGVPQPLSGVPHW